MKWINTLFLALLSTSLFAQQYNYKFKIKGLTDTTIYMANYYGSKQYYNDTAVVNSNGEFTFTGNKSKPGGIYTVIMPDKKSYLEVVINGESSFEVESDLKDLTGNALKIKGSKENSAFYEYVRFASNAQAEGKALAAKLEAAKDDEEKAKYQAEQIKLLEDGDQFKEDYLKKYDGLFAATVLASSKDPEVPEVAPEGMAADSNWQYKWFRNHYFDHIDLKDERLLRTPVLHQKIDYYITKLTPQVPDSICSAIDYLVSMTGDTGLVFRYIVQYTTNKYERSKIMGMDAVFVCMAEKYYVPGKATWIDSTQYNDIKSNYDVRKNLILGKKAENIILLDTAGEWQSMNDMEAKYTVLVFWDPNCGHCKKEIPQLGEDYLKWKEEGLDIEVYSVSTEFENKDWKKFVKKHNLQFTNVSDNPEINENAWDYISKGKTTLNSLNFRDFWDIFSTPQIYLLDTDKKIIAKRLTSEQITGFIESYEKTLKN